MYDKLPLELWIKIMDYTQELGLLLTNKSFFELLYLVKFETNVIEYVVENNLPYILRYIIFLKNINHPIIMENVIDIKCLEKYLNVSCKNGKLDIVKHLVDIGANIFHNKNCAIMLASEYGHLEIVKYLASKGCDVRADNDYAVIYASKNGHIEVVKYLVFQGCDVRSYNSYAVRLASIHGHLEIVKFLVKKGANYRALNHHAVIEASKNKHYEIVEFLMNYSTGITK